MRSILIFYRLPVRAPVAAIGVSDNVFAQSCSVRALAVSLIAFFSLQKQKLQRPAISGSPAIVSHAVTIGVPGVLLALRLAA